MENTIEKISETEEHHCAGYWKRVRGYGLRIY